MNKIKTKIQKEIVDSLDNPSHGILLLAPRVGKTKIAIDTIKKEKCKSILWVTPSIKLRDIDIPEEFNTWKAKNYLKKTEIICWSSLADHQGEYNKIILDEYQEITENNSRGLLDGRIKYKSILCLSGTHPKHDEKRAILNSLKLDILVEKTIEEAIEEELISDYDIKVVEQSLDDIRRDVPAGSKTKPFVTTEKKMYDYLSQVIRKMTYGKKNPQFMILKRMHLIYNSVTKEQIAKFLINKLEGRKLIFAGSIKQSERLSKYTFNSSTDDTHLNKFLNQEVDTLACVKSGGTGFTYKNIDHLIIVQSDSDKKGETTQKFCRSLLLQNNYKAKIWFICLTGTQDEKWIEAALESFDKSKVEYVRFVNLQNQWK